MIYVSPDDTNPHFTCAYAACQGLTDAFLLAAGSVVVWIPVDVRGFRLVLARDWHGAQSAARTGAQLAAGTNLLVRTLV